MNKWAKYEPAGCFTCNKGQITLGGQNECSVTYWRRCSCSRIKTKRYKKFLKGANKMIHKKFKKKAKKFYDNNSYITTGSNAIDRSW